MKLGHAREEKSIFQKEFLAVFIVVTNAFVWYTLVYMFIIDTVYKLNITNIEVLTIFAFHYLGIICSAILGRVLLLKFIDRSSFLVFWMFLGVCSSLLLIIFEVCMPFSALIVSLILGISIGIGFPSVLAYFADFIAVENRGRVGGIIWVTAGIGTLLLAVFSFEFNPSVTITILTVWRAIGLVIFFFIRQKQIPNLKMHYSYFSILTDKHLSLYLLPWIMFCLINWIETPIVENLFGEEFFSFITFIEFALSGIFALVGGFFADKIGRKRVIMTGFVMLGLEYAILSFLPEFLFSWYLYVIFDGITWGMFAVTFFIVLWGDLAENMTKEKYYVVGGLPYLLSSFLQILVKPYVKFIPTEAAFSLASFFLFLAVIPLMFAPETLPEKKMKERELKKYVEKAKNIKEKYD